MLTLCGFPISNYYNKVKLALLEKDMPFEEEVVTLPISSEAALAASPLGKVPFLRTPQGDLCESQAIMEYIEAACPQPPLLRRCENSSFLSNYIWNWWRANCMDRLFLAAR